MAETSDRCRVVPWHSIRLAISISLLSLCVIVVQAEGSSCSHKYTEHLNTFPTCSPYINQILKVECTVEVPLNGTDISIGWFMDCQELSNNTRVAIFSMVQEATEVLRIRSRLTISDITDEYAGKYTCNMLGDAEYVPSDQLELGDSNVLEIDRALGPCVNGSIFLNAEPAAEKCAVISENNSVPMSLACESPPATSSPTQPPSSTPVLLSASPSSSSPPIITPTNPPSSSNPSSSMPSPTDPTVATNTQDPSSIWLYVVVAIAAVFFMIIVVLAIVCVGMCVIRNRALEGPVAGQQVVVKITSMQPNTGYEGEFYPDSGPTASPPPPLPHHPSLISPYNTMGSTTADYETVGPGSNYQRLERPTLKATGGMMSRLGSIPDTFSSPSTTLTSVYPISPSSRNGGPLPPPLPSTARLGGKTPYSPESSGTFDSAFHTGVVDVSSPLERDRMDSTSMLIPKEKKSASTNSVGTGDFEGLYTPRGQRNSPSSSPSMVAHPLQNIPESSASFPEPRNPRPFPTTTTYESIPGDDSSCSGTSMVVAGYEKPLPSPNKSVYPRAITLPASPPPAEGRGHDMSTHHNCFREGGGSITLSSPPPVSSRAQEMELATMSGPTYHTLEESSHNGSAPSNLADGQPPPPPYPLVETAHFTLGSDSGSNTLTPGFPVVSADFADSPADGVFPVSKLRPQRRQVANELSSDFTGESDYPQLDDALTDCTGGSSSTAYPESEWTGGMSTAGANGTLAGDSTVFHFNGRPPSHNGSTSSARTLTPLSDGGLHRPTSTESSHQPPSYDGTPNNRSLLSNGETPNISPLNGMTSLSHDTLSNGRTIIPNGSYSVAVQFPHVPAGSSHTVPANSGSSVVSPHEEGGPSSHTISSAARNHYKKLDPTTMDPRLKYTRLNVGKLTVV